MQNPLPAWSLRRSSWLARSSGWLHGEGIVQFMRANWMPVLAAGAITGFALAALSALIAHLRNREYVSLAERLRLELRQEQLSRQMAETRDAGQRRRDRGGEPRRARKAVGSSARAAGKTFGEPAGSSICSGKCESAPAGDSPLERTSTLPGECRARQIRIDYSQSL